MSGSGEGKRELPNPDLPIFPNWVSSATSPFVSYRAGSHSKTRWNQGVFGPAMPEQAYETHRAYRFG